MEKIEEKEEQQEIEITQEEMSAETIPSNIINETITYKNISVHVVKINKKLEIRGSVDGNKYGRAYDKTTPNGFSDKNLLQSGYKEIVAQNGSTFYT
jgi:hypothetical protein